jgi:hypothetical protein
MKGSRSPSSTARVLVQHVRADLVPPADIGLGSLDLVLLRLPLADLQFVEPGAQHAHRLVPVAVLGTVVLALHDRVGGQVGDPNRRLGLVDVLAAGAGGPEHVDAQVRGIDVDLDRIVHFRIDVHRCEGRVATAAGIERRLAYQPVDAGFGAQVAVGVLAIHLDGGALDPGDIARCFLEDSGLEAAPLAIAQVLAQQHRRPVAGFGAAGAGLDFDEAVAGVGRIVEHPPEFKVLDAFLDLLGVGLDGDDRLVVALVHRHLEEIAGVRQRLRQAGQAEHRGLERALLAPEGERGFGIVPDVRRLERRIDFYQAVLLVFEVKDTP